MHFHSHQGVRLVPQQQGGLRRRLEHHEAPRNLRTVLNERKVFRRQQSCPAESSTEKMLSSQAAGRRQWENEMGNGGYQQLETNHSDADKRKERATRGRIEEESITQDQSQLVVPCATPEGTAITTPRASGITVVDAKSSEFLRLNIGGQRFMIRTQTLLNRNTGRLSWLASVPHEERMKLADGFFETTREYYFERPPSLFHVVFQYYLSGQIHQPSHLCPTDILDELEWWGVRADGHLAPCCCLEDKNDLLSVLSESDHERPNAFKHLYLGELRRKVWDVIEEPTSGKPAQVFATLSVLFVLISISGLVLGSLPELQVPTKESKKGNGPVEKEPHPYLQQIEYICIIWFAFEYGMKMLVSADRRRTFFQLLNIIDLLAILPFLIEMTLMIFGIDTEQLRDLKGAFLVIRILRVLRVIRVLKLGRYSSGLQMFGKTLQASFRQLGMMAMVVLTGVIFFSTLVYFLEKDEPNSQFYSIPAACWWCIVTMTTVGYGDLTPVTVPGKLVATGAIACGVLVLALPITIIVDNFMKVAEGERESNAAATRRYPPRRVETYESDRPVSIGSNAAARVPLKTEDTVC